MSASAASRPGLPVVAPRESRRGRRGRGARGPLVLPGPLNARVPIVRPTRREEFDDLVLSLVDRLASRWEHELEDVEFGTEDVPEFPGTWRDEAVPFGSLVPARSGSPARIVLFRRPIELRARDRQEQTALVNEVLVEHIAQLLGRDPAEIDE